MRYQCMEACRGAYPVGMMARLLAVSPSGYYEWRWRPTSARAASARRLVAEMHLIHQESDGTYGTPRCARNCRPVAIPWDGIASPAMS